MVALLGGAGRAAPSAWTTRTPSRSQFWEWLIRDVQDAHPDVVFLSEAFTRPKVMKALAKVGFTQSYTYFTWRNFKDELEEYLEELTTPPVADYFRGNLWPNTPDILPEILQHGGPARLPAARWRWPPPSPPSTASTAATSCARARPLPGKEEYLDSEKYQLRVGLEPARQHQGLHGPPERSGAQHPALQTSRNVRFYAADNERVLFYGTDERDRDSVVLVAVSLDPYAPQEATLHVPLEELGIAADETYQVHELMTDSRALAGGRGRR